METVVPVNTQNTSHFLKNVFILHSLAAAETWSEPGHLQSAGPVLQSCQQACTHPAAQLGHRIAASLFTEADERHEMTLAANNSLSDK